MEEVSRHGKALSEIDLIYIKVIYEPLLKLFNIFFSSFNFLFIHFIL